MVKGTTPDPTKITRIAMSREAGKKQYKATVETPCGDHGPRSVTITGDGRQVWGAAMATRAVIEENGGESAVHFYIDDKEIDWQETMAEINFVLVADELLRAGAHKVYQEDLPF